jgi:hypothetical protein
MGFKKRTAFISAVAVLIAATSLWGQWQYLGPANLQVETLEVYDNYLYAGTVDGIYRLDLNGTGTDWTRLGLQGNTVRALLIINSDTIFAGMTTGLVSIYRTTNGGVDWIPFDNGYGGGEFHPVFSFEKLPQSNETIFATGIAVIAKSVDLGWNWQAVWGDWHWMAMGIVFIKADQTTPNIIWAGGEAAIFSPWLFKSTDYGNNWEMVDIWGGGDNRCHDIAIHPGNSNMAWVPMEGLIRKTTDGGENWWTVLQNDYYLYGIEIDTFRPRILYSSGFRYDKPLTLFITRNGGYSWRPVYYYNEVTNGALDIVMDCGLARNVIYFATLDGVYKYTDTRPWVCADADADGNIDLLDITYLIDYIYRNGAEPDPVEAGDVNSDGSINILDIIRSINYLYKGGFEPDCPQLD